MAAIELVGIDKRFGEVVALSSVSLEIKSGEFFTLLGPSGCGKTTLLRSLIGFERPDAGTITVEGKRIDGVPAHKRNMGMVFQSYALFPHMTVFENVAFGLRNRGVDRKAVGERVERVLEAVHLAGFGERTPDQLSGGQQQRVGLARAMVIEPQVLLMDEPLSNLDAKLRLQLRDEIRDVQQQLGITTLYVTHDQEEALAVSDRIAVMDAGVVQQVGTPWEIYHEPANAFVASFVGKINFIEDADMARRVGEGLAGAPESVRLAVRPEDVRVSVESEAEPDDAALRLAGKTINSTFTGALVSYSIDCGEAGHVVAERHRPGERALIPPGTPVTVSMPVSSVARFDRASGRRL